MKFAIEQLDNNIVLVKTIIEARHIINYDLLREPNKDECDAIDEWVTNLQLGHRISWDRWVLKNKKCLTLFLLKWQNNET